MATKLKTLGEMVDEGETVWLNVKMSDFASSQTLSQALEAELEKQASDLNYVYAERDGRVSLSGGDVDLVLTIGGDGVYGTLVENRGDQDGNYGTVDVAFDLGLEEVRALTN